MSVSSFLVFHPKNELLGETVVKVSWISDRNFLKIAIDLHFSALSEVQLSHSGCGRLLVVIQCAKQLLNVNTDPLDTFCLLSLGGQSHTTPVVPSSSNPSWNSTMQFIVKDPKQDVLCISVLQKQKFSPNGEYSPRQFIFH